MHLEDAGSLTFVGCLTRVSLPVSQLYPAFAVVVSVSQGSRILANQSAAKGAACTFSWTTTTILCLRRTPLLHCNYTRRQFDSLTSKMPVTQSDCQCVLNFVEACGIPATHQCPYTTTTQVRHLFFLIAGKRESSRDPS